MERKRPPAIQRLDRGLEFLREYRALGITQAALLLIGYWLYLGAPVPDMPIYLRLEIATHQAAENITGPTDPTQIPLSTPQPAADYVIVRPGELAKRRAFPGAEGYGANATWGLKARRYNMADLAALGGLQTAGLLSLFRPLLSHFSLLAATPNDSVCNRSGARAFFVTNTNPTGAGSFEQVMTDSIRTDTMDYIIFRTGGLTDGVHLGTWSNTRYNCVYIAGQTAPGDDGFMAYLDQMNDVNDELWFLYAQNDDRVHDIIVRHMIFSGDSSDGSGPSTIVTYGTRDAIWDHVSFRFGRDMVFSPSTGDTVYGLVGNLKNLTVQWSIIGPAGPKGGLTHIQTPGTRSTWADSITYHHNLFNNANARLPKYEDSIKVEFINNVVWNWKRDAVLSCRDSLNYTGPWADFVRNYYKVGGATIENSWSGAARRWHRCCTALMQGDIPLPKIYLYGNVMDSLGVEIWDSTDVDSFKVHTYCGASGGDCGSFGDAVPSSVFVGSRFGGTASIPVIEQHAYAAYNSVVDSVGASRRLNCDGSWSARRDSLDALMLNEIVANTVRGGDQAWLGGPRAWIAGYPISMDAGSPCTDTDNDGMPDAWESLHGVSDPAADDDGDGYINLEEYLNGTDPI